MAWPDKPSRITVFIFCGGGEVRDITRSRFRFRPSIIRLPRLTRAPRYQIEQPLDRAGYSFSNCLDHST